MGINNKWQAIRLIAFSFILWVTVAGCVAQAPVTNESATSTKAVFFPPPPEAPRYQFLKSFYGPGDFEEKKASFLGRDTGGMRFKKPYGVLLRNGVINLADTAAGGIYQFDLVNKKFLAFRGSKGPGKIVQPINISGDTEGNIYVADPVRKQVLQYDKNDIFIRAFSFKDPWNPVDAHVYDGKLYVADSTRGGKGGIRVFDLKTGAYIETLGQSGKEDQKIGIASGISIDREGYIYVTDVGNFAIMRYDRDGHFRGRLGDAGNTPGHFGRPRGVAVDRAGRIYAVDAAFDVVQVFAATGQLLTYFGDADDSEPGSLTLPAGISIDYDNIDLFKQYAAPGFDIEYLILVSSQFNAKQVINVYAYGKMQGVDYKSDQELYQELQQVLERKKAEAQGTTK